MEPRLYSFWFLSHTVNKWCQLSGLDWGELVELVRTFRESGRKDNYQVFEELSLREHKRLADETGQNGGSHD